MVLGIISDSNRCLDSIRPHLTTIVPFLKQELDNTNEVVRATTIWTLSKFSDWIVQQDVNFYKEVLSSMLSRIMDVDSNVQEAACISFSLLIEARPELVVPYINDILHVFIMVIDQYKGKSLVSLFDSIGTMAQLLGGNLRNPDVIQKLMGLMFKKFHLI